MSIMKDAADLDMVYDSTIDFLVGAGGLSHARKMRFTDTGIDREVWRAIADMGWLGVLTSEEQGGSGFGMSAYARIALGAGRYLLPEPVVGAVFAASIMGGDQLSQVLSGNTIVLPAWQNAPNSLEMASAANEGNTCFAERRFVAQGMSADQFLVSDGDGWALVSSEDKGVRRRSRATQNGGHYCDLLIEGATILETFPANPIAFESATLAQAAYQLGLAQSAYEMTIEYLCTREQFGKPIGSFQALQHRAADLRIQLDLARASISSAAALLDHQSATIKSKRAAVSRAKARSSDAAMLVTRQGVQLHGAIGYTDECDIGLFLRAAMSHCPQYGSAALHRQRYGQLLENHN